MKQKSEKLCAAFMRAASVVETELAFMKSKISELEAYKAELYQEAALAYEDAAEAEETVTTKAEPLPAPPDVVMVTLPTTGSDFDLDKLVPMAPDRVSRMSDVQDVYIDNMGEYALKEFKKAWNIQAISMGKEPGLDIVGIPTSITFKCKEFVNEGQVLPTRNPRNLSVFISDNQGNILWGKDEYLPISTFTEEFYLLLKSHGINKYYKSSGKALQRVQTITFTL